MRFIQSSRSTSKMMILRKTILVHVIIGCCLVTRCVAADAGQPHHRRNNPQQHQQQRKHHRHTQQRTSTQQPIRSCDSVREEFVQRGIGPSHLVPATPGSGAGLKHCPSVAAHTCCSAPMLHKYETSIVGDYETVVAGAATPLTELLAKNIFDFERHYDQLLEISRNKTNNLFQTVYPRMSSSVAPRLHDLYADFRAFLLQGHKVDVLDSLRGFFDGFFPSVYYHALNPKLTDFTDDYKECLQEARTEVHPFGQVMRRIELTVPHALMAAELFLDALRTGSDVMNSTHGIKSTHECNHALLNLTYCARCSGHVTVPPCWGMCLNVMRGCLAPMSEIDRNWNSYINALEDLIGVMKSPFNLEEVLNEFPEKISEAIMHALEHGKYLDDRVRRACGQPKRKKPQQRTGSEGDPGAKDRRRRESPALHQVSTAPQNLASRLNAFLIAVGSSKGFFVNLADTTCKDTKFSGQARLGQHCWNGIEIGAYNKTIVGVGLSKQEHNPELKVRKKDGDNSKIIDAILEKLFRIKQHMLASPVTRDISRSSKKIRFGSRNFNPLSPRGEREAQYYGGSYGGSYDNYYGSRNEWDAKPGGNGHDSGSGYYDDDDDDDNYYDDEDLYDGSGGGVGVDEPGSGQGSWYDPGSGYGYPAHNPHHRKTQRTPVVYEERPQQPKATKNPAQNTHNYVVNPVRDDNGVERPTTGVATICIVACSTAWFLLFRL